MSKVVGVQLYAVREELGQDFPGTIRRLAEIGYPTVEGYNGLPLGHEVVAGILSANGLTMASCHLPLPFGKDEAVVMGAIEAYDLRYVLAPYQPREEFTTSDGVKRVCERLNRANDTIRSQGLVFGYHNHEFEFGEVDGRSAYDLMLEELDPSVILELDVYWAQTSGYDSAELVRKLGERAPLLHIKDGEADANKRDAPHVALGEGVVDVEAIIAAGGDHTKHLIVELDSCASDMLEAIRKSFRYLMDRGLSGEND
jgi:sugar phosphate isomerase/epimerase